MPPTLTAASLGGNSRQAMKTLERAAKLVETMPKEKTPERHIALTALACVQARLGDFAAARKTTDRIQGEPGKTVALSTLVRQLARADRAKEALAEIDQLPAGTTKFYALMNLGAGQADAGDQKAARASFEKAHQLIGELQGEGKRGVNAIDLATVRAQAEDYKGAIQTADTYFPNVQLGYVNIANARAEAGDFKGALEAADQIKEPPGQGPGWWKLNTLRDTAKLQAQSGESKEALNWIDRLDSHIARAHALMGLAEGMVAPRAPGKK
jgi:tetratricopeptide (TPR) repeat protein